MVVSGNITKYVLDSSFVLSFLLPDEHSARVDEYFDQYDLGMSMFLSSGVLSFEVMNGLLNAIKRKRIDQKKATILLKGFTNLRILYEPIDETTIFRLAREKSLTIYDASYLAIALKYKVPLLTFDKHLKPFSQSL